MQVTVSENAGFCFGVKLAVKSAFDVLKSTGRCCTLGEIIHNPHVISEFKKRGGVVVNELSDIPKDCTLIIRAHGVGADVLNRIKENNTKCVDATCPFVKKIHKIVSEYSNDGYFTIIAGDPNHCEVEGIVGNCFGPYTVIENKKQLEKFFSSQNVNSEKFIFVSQTTFSLKEWQLCCDYIKNKKADCKIFNTICMSTELRQKETEKISEKSDIMIVVGGNNSSNSLKLKSICEKNCKTYFLQTPGQLNMLDFRGDERIGLTAGASVPYEDVMEIKKMLENFKGETMDTEIKNSAENNAEAENVENKEQEDIVSGEILKGTVTELTPNEVKVDIGRKYVGVVPLTELTTDLSKNTADLVHVGETLELAVVNFNAADGTVILSKKQVDFTKGWDTIVNAHKTGEQLSANVVEVVRGGLKLVCNGIKIFIPASLSGSSRNNPLENFKGKVLEFKVIELDEARKRAIGSCVAANDQDKKEMSEKFWQEVKIGDVVEGTVSGLAPFGAFVDLGGLEGLIHISEISWNRISSPSDVLKMGQKVRVLVKDMDKAAGRVSLSYKQVLGDPWEIFSERYKVVQIITCKITAVKDFGAFAEIMPGVEGMIHVSQISEGRIENPQDVLSAGDEVRVKIVEMDPLRRRVGLSIRDCFSIN